MGGEIDFEFLQSGLNRAIRKKLDDCCVSKWLIVAETAVGLGRESVGLWCVASMTTKAWDVYGMIACRDLWHRQFGGLADAAQGVFGNHERSVTTKMVVVVEVITTPGRRELWYDLAQDMQPWDIAGLLQFAKEEESAHHRMH